MPLLAPKETAQTFEGQAGCKSWQTCCRPAPLQAVLYAAAAAVSDLMQPKLALPAGAACVVYFRSHEDTQRTQQNRLGPKRHVSVTARWWAALKTGVQWQPTHQLLQSRPALRAVLHAAAAVVSDLVHPNMPNTTATSGSRLLTANVPAAVEAHQHLVRVTALGSSQPT